MGIPIGTNQFVQEHLSKILQRIRAQAPEVLKMHNAYSSLRMVKCSMNLKIIHLLHALPPHVTWQFAFDFDNLIMGSLGQLLDFEP
ncbi:MAG: hypothetical protein ACK56I_13140, partial [bacterium]